MRATTALVSVPRPLWGKQRGTSPPRCSLDSTKRSLRLDPGTTWSETVSGKALAAGGFAGASAEPAASALPLTSFQISGRKSETTGLLYSHTGVPPACPLWGRQCSPPRAAQSTRGHRYPNQVTQLAPPNNDLGSISGVSLHYNLRELVKSASPNCRSWILDSLSVIVFDEHCRPQSAQALARRAARFH